MSCSHKDLVYYRQVQLVLSVQETSVLVKTEQPFVNRWQRAADRAIPVEPFFDRVSEYCDVA